MGMTLAFGDLEPSSQPGSSDLREVVVPLLGLVGDLQGMDIPKTIHSEAVGSIDLLQPHRLTIRLPDGRELSVIARSTSLITRDGIAAYVYVRRPIQPARFKDAVADLRRTMQSLEIEPNEKMARDIESWGDNNPGRDEGGDPDPSLFKTGVIFDPQFGHLHVRVIPDPEKGWFYLMEFAASSDASRAARDTATPNANPTKPPEAKR
jgi:hypothetical protein